LDIQVEINVQNGATEPVFMPQVLDPETIDQLTLDAELAMRRARRMLEWMRVIYESEARILTDSDCSGRQNFRSLRDETVNDQVLSLVE
jgi:hypothetical protein